MWEKATEISPGMNSPPLAISFCGLKDATVEVDVVVGSVVVVPMQSCSSDPSLQFGIRSQRKKSGMHKSSDSHLKSFTALFALTKFGHEPVLSANGVVVYLRFGFVIK